MRLDVVVGVPVISAVGLAVRENDDDLLGVRSNESLMVADIDILELQDKVCGTEADREKIREWLCVMLVNV